MNNLRFADNLDGEAVVALGLPAPRLILAGLGAASAWALSELPLPDPLRLGTAGLLALTTAILAWGRVQGVSLARWTWLALGYAGRVVTASGRGSPQWVDADSRPDERPVDSGLEPDLPLIAFLSLRRGVGCTSVCRAVAIQLRGSAREGVGGSRGRSAAALWVVADPQGGAKPSLLLGDWGSGPQNRPSRTRVTGLVLVWDGEEVFPGALADKVVALQRSFPGVEVLVAVNRASSASGLSARIAGAGARLAGAIPVDECLGDPDLTPLEATALTSADGVRALAREVLAASRSW